MASDATTSGGVRLVEGGLAKERTDEFEWTAEEVFKHRETTKLALEATTDALEKMDVKSSLKIERESVYGYALVLPQVARSTDYDHLFTALALRSFFYFILNIVVQMWLLCFIGEASQVMAPLGGQMHLCDFGAYLDECPEGGDKCMGPGGTLYTRTRLYSYMQWNIQTYVKNALLEIVPEKADEIQAKVDPGEYGMESRACRFLCCFLFAMSVVDEIVKCFNMAELLHSVPTKEQSWVYYHSPDADAPMEEASLLGYRVQGMPLRWKLWNVVFVLLPKMALCWFVLTEGFILLMDTGGILDLVLGAMSLKFVLDIDEIICLAFNSAAARYIMESLHVPEQVEVEFDHNLNDPQSSYKSLSGFHTPRDGHGHRTEAETPDEVLARIKSQTMRVTKYRIFRVLFPRRLFLVLMVMLFFISKYYYRRCDPWGGGTFVSKEMYLPKSSHYSIIDFLFNTVATESEPFWTMPSPTDEQ